jgi:hypothetical protein
MGPQLDLGGKERGDGRKEAAACRNTVRDGPGRMRICVQYQGRAQGRRLRCQRWRCRCQRGRSHRPHPAAAGVFTKRRPTQGRLGHCRFAASDGHAPPKAPPPAPRQQRRQWSAARAGTAAAWRALCRHGGGMVRPLLRPASGAPEGGADARQALPARLQRRGRVPRGQRQMRVPRG